MSIDLTGGEVNVVGNLGDSHIFRLRNPVDQNLISEDGEYAIEFSGGSDSVQLNLDELSEGVLIIPITIKNGVYKIRRLNPRRTLLTIGVEAV